MQNKPPAPRRTLLAVAAAAAGLTLALSLTLATGFGLIGPASGAPSSTAAGGLATGTRGAAVAPSVPAARQSTPAEILMGTEQSTQEQAGSRSRRDRESSERRIRSDGQAFSSDQTARDAQSRSHGHDHDKDDDDDDD
jgi:hypothetical protein